MKSRKGTPKKAVKGPTKTSGMQSPHPAAPSPEEIRARAYEIYIDRGQTEGRELDDWLQAEIELIESLRKRQSD